MTEQDCDALFVQLSRDVDALMRAHNMSQRALAHRAHLSDQTVLNILKGRNATMESVLRVLHVLGAEFKICPTEITHIN